MQEGLQRAVGVPLSLAERISVLWPCLKELVAYGNMACKSDAQVSHKDSVCTCTDRCSPPAQILTAVYCCFVFLVLQVAAKALETAVFGAYYNVMINLKDITDAAFRLAVSASISFLTV